MIYVLPFLSILAGYAVALGLRGENRSRLKLLLAFSGSFLLSLTVLHLLPEVYQDVSEHQGRTTGLFIMGGILLQIALEFFSKGAEHGHVHFHGPMRQIPWALFASLCLHALLEGYPVGHNPELALGIAIHHFPIAVILTVFFLNAEMKRSNVLIFMLAFALMTPLGTILSTVFPLEESVTRALTALVIGILLHIASTIIFESSENHKFNLAKLSVILLGIALAAFL